MPCPLRLRAHSTRGVILSWELAHGASLADIFKAAGWATPNTFARFYSLRVEPVSSCVLTSNRKWHWEAQFRVGLRRPYAEFSREFPDRANPVESSSTPADIRGRVSSARPFSQLILEIWCEASANMSDPVGIPFVFSTVFLLEPCFPWQTTFCRLL